MSIPPNDAFSLNAHNHTHSHRPKALSRSPPPSYSFLPHTSHSSSPQQSFSGSLKKGEAHKTHVMSLRQRKPSASKAVNGSAIGNGVMNGSAHHEPLHDEQTREANGNGHAVVEKLKTVKPPIDWEIPRKVFHSSIGASRFFCASSHVGLRRMPYADEHSNCGICEQGSSSSLFTRTTSPPRTSRKSYRAHAPSSPLLMSSGYGVGGSRRYTRNALASSCASLKRCVRCSYL